MLDIGAGYGRLAHRMTRRLPQRCATTAASTRSPSRRSCASTTCATAASPRRRASCRSTSSTPSSAPGAFDLAVNIHSFSECTLAAIEWWVERARAARGAATCSSCPTSPTELLSARARRQRGGTSCPLLERRGLRARRARAGRSTTRRSRELVRLRRPLPPVRARAEPDTLHVACAAEGGYVAAQRGDAALGARARAATDVAACTTCTRRACAAARASCSSAWCGGAAARSRFHEIADERVAGLPRPRLLHRGDVVPDLPARAAARRRPRAVPRRRHARGRRPRAAVGHRPRRHATSAR